LTEYLCLPVQEITSFSTSTNQATVNLTGVSNAQTITIALSGVKLKHVASKTAVAVPMSILVGNTTGDGVVDSADVSQTKSQSGRAVTNLNSRQDVNADDSINRTDILLIRSFSDRRLP
jgi:hypothetical protein